MMNVKERNRQIISEYNKGTSYDEIGEMFGLSKMSVYQVIQRMKDKQVRYIDNELYQALLSVCNEDQAAATSNALRRGGIMSLEQLKKSSIEDISKLNWIGRTRIHIIEQLKSL